MTLGKLGDMTISQARQRARDLLSDISKGSDPSSARSKLRSEDTIAELGRRYLEARKLKASTRGTYEDLLRIQIGPKLGKMKISAVTKADIRDLYKRVSATAPSRAILMVKLLRAMLGWAVEEEILEVNVAKHVKIGSIKQRRRYLSPDERRRFWGALASLENASNFHRPTLQAIRLIALTGARKSEICALRWSEVDLERRRIVKETHKTDEHGAVRTILLSEDALEILSSLAENRGGLTWVFPSCRDPGRPIPDVADAHQRIIEIAEIEDFHPHDLRHSYASDGMTRGFSLMVIKELLGHSSIATTQRYAHLSDKAARHALSEISAEMNPHNVIELDLEKRSS